MTKNLNMEQHLIMIPLINSAWTDYDIINNDGLRH